MVSVVFYNFALNGNFPSCCSAIVKVQQRSCSAWSPVRINSSSLVVSLLSLSGCPNNEANQAKIFPKHSAKSPVSKKTPHLSPTSTSPPSVSGGVKGQVGGSIISTRSSAR